MRIMAQEVDFLIKMMRFQNDAMVKTSWQKRLNRTSNNTKILDRLIIEGFFIRLSADSNGNALYKPNVKLIKDYMKKAGFKAYFIENHKAIENILDANIIIME